MKIEQIIYFEKFEKWTSLSLEDYVLKNLQEHLRILYPD